MDARESSLDEFHRRLRDGDLEGALGALRLGGRSKAESILELVRTRAFDFEQAKTQVHESETWRDVRARDAEIHDRFLDVLEEWAREAPPTEDG